MTLAATRIGADSATRTMIMLHGIYGRGRNWQAIAKAVVAARPDYACWLVDLPHHGDSGPGGHGDSIRGFAEDLQEWCDTEGLVPDVVLGHSFGGKVALALAERLQNQPLQVWVIDSTPETKSPGGSAWDMLRLIRGMPQAFATREEAADAIMAGGYSRGVATWMSSNLVRRGEQFEWQLDFSVMEPLLHDFFTDDLWPAVEHHAPGHRLHFLKASTSSAMSDDAASRVEALHDAQVSLHRRDGTHWIHAESPEIVIDLLLAHLA